MVTVQDRQNSAAGGSGGAGGIYGGNGMVYKGGAATVSGAPTLPNGVTTYSVTANTGNLTFNGATGANAAEQNGGYKATFEAHTGYNLPENITVRVGAIVLSPTTHFTYTHDGRQGHLIIPYTSVNGDISITITAAPRETTIALVDADGTGGEGSIIGTYGALLASAVSLPTRAGYSFGGYSTQREGGSLLYNAAGQRPNGGAEYTDSSGKRGYTGPLEPVPLAVIRNGLRNIPGYRGSTGAFHPSEDDGGGGAGAVHRQRCHPQPQRLLFRRVQQCAGRHGHTVFRRAGRAHRGGVEQRYRALQPVCPMAANPAPHPAAKRRL